MATRQDSLEERLAGLEDKLQGLQVRLFYSWIFCSIFFNSRLFGKFHFDFFIILSPFNSFSVSFFLILNYVGLTPFFVCNLKIIQIIFRFLMIYAEIRREKTFSYFLYGKLRKKLNKFSNSSLNIEVEVKEIPSLATNLSCEHFY